MPRTPRWCALHRARPQRPEVATTLLLCGAWNLHTRLRPRGRVGLNLREMEEGADAAKVMAKGEEERHVQR
jgi:hypothetical protein